MNLDYLDDITLGGPVQTVASDAAEIMRTGAEIGISLNISRYELTAHSDTLVNDTLLQSFIVIQFNVLSKIFDWLKIIIMTT